jgi:pyroglutamyl-peptidase
MSGNLQKVLITGFEPFGGSRLNPSELLVTALQKVVIPGVHLETLVLPVEYERSTKILLEKIMELKPDVVMAFGQAEGRKAITPEKIAINLDNARIADNSGVKRENQAIDSQGNDGYFTTLPIERIVEAISRVGVPVELSLSAGAFVCNHLFYELQKFTKDTAIQSGFIHIPLVTEQSSEFPGQPTLALEELVQGARAAILSAL